MNSLLHDTWIQLLPDILDSFPNIKLIITYSFGSLTKSTHEPAFICFSLWIANYRNSIVLFLAALGVSEYP